MKRRRIWLGLAITCVSLAGCETTGHALRPKSEPPIVVLDEDGATSTREAQDDELRTGRPSGFFKATRRSGAWSSEAAEIERSLGVSR